MIYTVSSILYIYFSDKVLFLIYDKSVELDKVSKLGTYKGIVFVLFTSLLLFYLIRNEVRSKENIIEELKKSRERNKKIQVELRRRNEYIEYILSNLPIGISVYKTDTGEAVLMNHVFSAVFEVTKDKINSINAFLDALQSQDFRERVHQQIQSAETGLNEIDKEGLKIITNKGLEKYINVKSMVVNDHNLLISTVIDVTSMVLNENRLKESKELLEKLINNLNEVVLFVDPESRTITLANKAVQTVFGYSADELLGRQTSVLHVNQEMFEEFGKRSEPELSLRGMFTTEYQMVRKDGTRIDTENSVTSIRDDKGWQYGVISVIRDITEKKKAESRLLEYQQSLKQLTHKQTLTEEKQRKQIAANIHDHLSQLLLISKMKLGEMLKHPNIKTKEDELKSVILYLTEAIENTRKITYDLSPPILYELGLIETMLWYVEKVEKEHEISVTFVTNVEDLNLPEAQLILLFRIIQELVTNVNKHARADKIDIIINKSEQHLELIVKDDGIGFDRATKEQSSMNKSGYGLFSVKERVENLNGSFNITSEKFAGTTIKIAIPFNELKSHSHD